MKKVKIFVEGVTDVKLLRDFIAFKYDHFVDDSLFVKTGGYGGLFNEQNLNQLRLMNDDNGINLVIFDADSNFSERRQELLDKADERSIDIELFLFPNNTEPGDRETLLLQMVRQEKYNPFSICFNPYMGCLITHNERHIADGNSPLNSLPNRKVAVHNYLRLYGQETNERKRNYSDQNFWDLSHESLLPLHNFLSPFFT